MSWRRAASMRGREVSVSEARWREVSLVESRKGMQRSRSRACCVDKPSCAKSRESAWRCVRWVSQVCLDERIVEDAQRVLNICAYMDH